MDLSNSNVAEVIIKNIQLIEEDSVLSHAIISELGYS